MCMFDKQKPISPFIKTSAAFLLYSDVEAHVFGNFSYVCRIDSSTTCNNDLSYSYNQTNLFVFSSLNEKKRLIFNHVANRSYSEMNCQMIISLSNDHDQCVYIFALNSAFPMKPTIYEYTHYTQNSKLTLNKIHANFKIIDTSNEVIYRPTNTNIFIVTNDRKFSRF